MRKRLRPVWARARAAVGYCVTHHKQLAAAASFGAALVEAVKKAH